jgi:hypothetical protein
MAGEHSEAVDLNPVGASAIGRVMSVLKPDLTSKGKASEMPGSSSLTVDDNVAEMMGRLQLTSQESNAFVLEDEDDEYPGCPDGLLLERY